MDTEMIDLKEIGQRIKRIREKLDLRQNQLAMELNISNGTLSEVESGNGKPNFDLLFNLSKKFDVNINYVLHGKGDIFNDDHLALPPGFYKGELAPIMERFIRYFNASELVRLYILAAFKEILLKNEEMIELEIKREKKST
jgi:transcriptional regulator with XRE-family HTH domain